MQPGPQFEGFHGTATPLGTGDSVLPPSKSGARQLNVPRGVRKPEYDPWHVAHATTKENVAWAFASYSADKAGGRASVKTVSAPKETVRPGVENRHNPDWTPHYAGGQLPDNKEYVSPQFKVEGSVDIMPPETVRKPGKHMRYAPNPNGRQGTLPIDWTPSTVGPRHQGTRWESVGPLSPLAANHPTQADRVASEKRVVAKDIDGPKYPPMYLGGYKVDDSVSEKHQAQQASAAPSQPMLPGMRGAVKRTRKTR